jgi:hypothetical protein
MSEGDGFWSLFMTGVLSIGFSLFGILLTRKHQWRRQSWWENRERMGIGSCILIDRMIYYGFLPVGLVLVVIGLVGWLIANLA